MKNYLPLFLLCFHSAFLCAQTDGDHLFDTDVLHEIRFESDDPAFFTTLVNTWFEFNIIGIPYLPAKISIDGNVLDSIGVRIKGGLSAFNAKRPLKIDFNTFVAGQQYDGLKMLNLANADFDTTLMRDVLSSTILRMAGVKSPRTAYTKVYINNEYHGVYVMIEQVDDIFLRNYFADDNGTLYKNKSCQVEVESGDSTLTHYQEMLQIAQNQSGADFVDALEKVLDTEAFLRYFLVEHFICAADNPLDVGCNYYIYHSPKSDLLYWIPWDLNYTFFSGNSHELMYPGTNVVFKKMLNTPYYRERYLTLACELLDYLSVDTVLLPLIDHHRDLIYDAVDTDPRYAPTTDQFVLRVDILKSLVEKRYQDFEEDLQEQLFTCLPLESPLEWQGISINEIMASSDSLSGIADPSGDYADWVELYNNSTQTVSLKGFYLSHDRDFSKHWAFPDSAKIDPGQYLIVWADRDIDEPGLHTDFKLDKKGGFLQLMYEDFTVVDTVSFPQQQTNVAWARVPNGTGPFVAQSATFAGKNAEESAVSSLDAPQAILQVLPNPATHRVAVRVRGNETAQRSYLYDMQGRLVAQQPMQEHTCTFDVSKLSPGVYRVLTMTASGYLQSAVTVQR